MGRIAVITLSIVALGYVVAAAYLAINEKDLVFHPAERAVAPPAAGLGLTYRPVRYSSTDGTTLSAWIIPATTRDSSGMWMLICHGNYGNIGYAQRPEFYSFARELGLNLLAFDYRGFGDSEGTPDEDGLYEDAVASFRYLTDSLHVPPSQIVIFGHSLGSGVATELATRVDAAALVLEGAFTSVADRGQEVYPYFPVRLIATQRFASLDKLPRVREPKLFLHSPEDDVIPYAHAERLLAAASGPKRLVAVHGGHMDAYSRDKSTYFGALASTVAQVRPQPTAAASVGAAATR